MKNLILAFVALLLASAGTAQIVSSENLPVDVTSTFKNKYATAKKPVWQMDYDNYLVEFTFLETPMTALFTPDGNWVETHYYVNPTELPKEVKDSLSKHFGGVMAAYKIEDAAKVENTEKEPMYIFVITQNLTTYDMILAENGHILQKEKRTEEGDGKIKFKRITKKKDSK